MNSGNSQFERDFESFLSSGDSQLEALYRKLPQAEPAARLDAIIQAMAQRAVAATAPPPARAPSHRRWLPMLSAAAVVALAAGIAFQIGPQLWQRPEIRPKTEPRAAPSALSPAAPQPAATITDAQKASAVPTAAPMEQAPAAGAPGAELKKVETAAPRSAPRAFPAPVAAMREPASPSAAGEAKPIPRAPAMAAPMRANQPADAESAGTPVQTLAAPAARDRNASLYPEHWLANIRQMLRDNQREAALRSLDEFRKKYPDYVLPDDLRDLH